MKSRAYHAMSPWALLRLAETFESNGDRATAEMLLDCVCAAFSASVELAGVVGPSATTDEFD